MIAQNKLHVPALNKTFTINHSNRNMRRAVKFQLDMLKVGRAEDSDDIEAQFKTEADFFDKLIAFPTEILKLTDKQAEKLDDLDGQELQKLDTKIALMIQGADAETINDTLKAMDEPAEDTPSKSAAE